MNCKILVILLVLSNFIFADKIPEKLRCDYALKMHQGFCLQSVGQSGSAFFSFNEGYQAALKAGISPQKLQAIWNFFVWYRKFGQYLGLFDATDQNRITDEYTGEKTNRSYRFRSEADKIRDRYEVAEISRDLIAGTAEFIGGLLGAAFLPNASWRISSLVIAIDAIRRIWAGVNRLKTFNDIVAYELKQRVKEIETAASNQMDEEWWLR